MILLLNLQSLLSADRMVWLVSIPLLIFALVAFYYQYRQYHELNDELAQLAKLTSHNIEHELVLKTMKLATWRVDVPTRVVTFENDYRDQLDSYVPQSGAGLDDVYSHIRPQDAERIRKGLTGLLTGSIDDYLEQYQVLLPDGTSYWGESVATVERRDLEGRPSSIVGVTRRIDEQKRTEQALIEARNHAEESDRLKSAFLANISHEIRTPLNAIVGFSDILPMAQSDEERQQLVDLIKQNNAHLLRLFNDMVNMSKIEAGSEGQVVKTSFSLDALLNELAAKYDQQNTNDNLSIEVDTGDNAFSVVTDRNRLAEILNQYMNNAVKFTQRGSVKLGYTLLDNQRLRVWVSDTGKGIPAEMCNDRLFERFFKVDEFIPGTGLGLSICRSLATGLGGTVGVESQEGEGSTFWVELPV